MSMIPSGLESNSLRKVGGNTRIPINELGNHALDLNLLAIRGLTPETISQQKLEARRKALIEGAMRAYFQKHETLSQDGKTEITYLLSGSIIGFINFNNALEMFNMSPLVSAFIDSEESIAPIFEFLSRMFFNNTGSMRSDLRGHEGPEIMEIEDFPTYKRLVDLILNFLKLGEMGIPSDSEGCGESTELSNVNRVDNEKTIINTQLAKSRVELFVYEVMASIVL